MYPGSDLDYPINDYDRWSALIHGKGASSLGATFRKVVPGVEGLVVATGNHIEEAS